jgi:hypothetical protein
MVTEQTSGQGDLGLSYGEAGGDPEVRVADYPFTDITQEESASAQGHSIANNPYARPG